MIFGKINGNAVRVNQNKCEFIDVVHGVKILGCLDLFSESYSERYWETEPQGASFDATRIEKESSTMFENELLSESIGLQFWAIYTK